MNFFKKKSKQPQGMAQTQNNTPNKDATQERPLNKAKLKYYEIFGDILALSSLKTTIIIALLGVIILLVVIIRFLAVKPPIVIRIDSAGDIVSFRNAASYQNITKPEVINFAYLFLEHFTEFNFYSFDDDMNKAANMMTQRMQGIASTMIQNGNIAINVEKNKTETKMTIKSVQVTKDTEDYIALRVTGRRNISSQTDNTLNKEEGFDIELAILKTGRTIEQPYGLLVDEFKETLY